MMMKVMGNMQTEPGDQETTEPVNDGDIVEKSVEIGVLATDITHRNSHLWAKGQSGNPAGRPPKTRENAVLNLMRSAIPPEQIVATVLGLITNGSSWRAREAGVKLYLSYMVGMPVQRSVTATTKLESILHRLGSMDEEEFTLVEEQMRGEATDI